MGKQSRYGICRLCGEYRALTFEHVPPRCAFNSTPAKHISGTEIMKTLGDDTTLPWDFSNLRSKTQQKGKGGYYLCSDCNSNTGSWYVPFYENFAQGIYSALQSGKISTRQNCFSIMLESIRPLPIFKQIMVMFCDINQNCFDDKKLRYFLMNKETESPFESNKYRVFCYLAKGPLLRMNGLSVHVYDATTNPIIVSMSEIITMPLGLALYIDMPEEFTPEGFEITGFSKYQYGDITSCELTLPILESNIAFSGDYRTKEEILSAVEKSQ